MSDLVEFLRARFDEDEAVARAAINHTGRWRWDHGMGDLCNDPECPYGDLLDEAEPSSTSAGTVLMEVHGYDVENPWEGAEHIARHDPARVLAEVKAKRRIIERHQSHSMGNCRVCEAPHWGVLVCNHCFGKAWPCPDLLDLAAVYAGHQDYRQEWTPEVP